MRLTIALPHTTPVFCQETWASTRHCAMLSDGQLELLNADTGRELSHIFSSMTLDTCGRDWRPSVPLEITPAEVRADPLLAEELNTFYGRFEYNGGSATLPISTSGSSRQSSDDHVITVSEDEVRRELKRVNVRKAAGPWWDYWPCSGVLCWSACLFVYIHI